MLRNKMMYINILIYNMIKTYDKAYVDLSTSAKWWFRGFNNTKGIQIKTHIIARWNNVKIMILSYNAIKFLSNKNSYQIYTRVTLMTFQIWDIDDI